jgi:hypothetical protein
MKTHTHTHTRTTTYTYTIPGTEIEVELPLKPDLIMEYREPLVRITDDQVILGYLAHDDDCANPLTDCDGMGHIYEARLHHRSLEGYCKALGLRHDGGGPDLDLVDEDKLLAAALAKIDADPDLFAAVLAYCEEHWDRDEVNGEPEDDVTFVHSCLHSPYELARMSVHAHELDLDDLRREMWEEGRKNGTIGNPYAVMLNVYEHGGIAYSLSGQGMQCQWDTASGGACWVPDDEAVDKIKSRGEVYRKGLLREKRFQDVTTWEVSLFTNPTCHLSLVAKGGFEHWHEAFEYLKGLEHVTFLRPLEEAEHIAARELAKQAAEAYTDWCNGNRYGVVVVTYDKAGNEINWDSVGGFVGDDNAYESLKNDYFPKEEA